MTSDTDEIDPRSRHANASPETVARTSAVSADQSRVSPPRAFARTAGTMPMPDEAVSSDDPPAARSSPNVVAPSTESTPQASQGGFGPLLAAALLGGITGGALVYGAQRLLDDEPSKLRPRLAQIESRLGALPAQDVLPALQTKLGTVEVAQAKLGEDLRASQALAQRAAEQASEALNRPSPAAPPSREAAEPPGLAEARTRLQALETRIGETGQASSAAAQAIESRLAEHANKVASVEVRSQERSQASAEAARALERRLAEQDARLADLARRVAERNPMSASLRLVLSDRLMGALRAGEPIGPVINALRRLDLRPENLAGLEPFAASPPPTTEALAREFRPLGERIVEASRPAASFTDRLWRMADKVVTVRPVENPRGSDAQSLVARTENALGRGALTEAASAWDALPEPSRRISEDWGRRLKQRAAADQAARRIAGEALSSLETATR